MRSQAARVGRSECSNQAARASWNDSQQTCADRGDLFYFATKALDGIDHLFWPSKCYVLLWRWIMIYVAAPLPKQFCDWNVELDQGRVRANGRFGTSIWPALSSSSLLEQKHWFSSQFNNHHPSPSRAGWSDRRRPVHINISRARIFISRLWPIHFNTAEWEG